MKQQQHQPTHKKTYNITSLPHSKLILTYVYVAVKAKFFRLDRSHRNTIAIPDTATIISRTVTMNPSTPTATLLFESLKLVVLLVKEINVGVSISPQTPLAVYDSYTASTQQLYCAAGSRPSSCFA